MVVPFSPCAKELGLSQKSFPFAAVPRLVTAAAGARHQPLHENTKTKRTQNTSKDSVLHYFTRRKRKSAYAARETPDGSAVCTLPSGEMNKQIDPPPSAYTRLVFKALDKINLAGRYTPA